MRAGRILATAATLLSLTFALGTLGSAGGCSGSSDQIEQAEVNEEATKVAQEKMREYMKNWRPQKNTPPPAGSN
jgi:hypothetical protein